MGRERLITPFEVTFDHEAGDMVGGILQKLLKESKLYIRIFLGVLVSAINEDVPLNFSLTKYFVGMVDKMDVGSFMSAPKH